MYIYQKSKCQSFIIPDYCLIFRFFLPFTWRGAQVIHTVYINVLQTRNLELHSTTTTVCTGMYKECRRREPLETSDAKSVLCWGMM